MNKVTKQIQKKVRVKTSHEVYYTCTHWPVKQIDGVDFLSVVKNVPSNQINQTQIVHLLRRDAVDFIK